MELQNKLEELQELLIEHLGEKNAIEVVDILLDKLKNNPSSIVPKLKMPTMLKLLL